MESSIKDRPQKVDQEVEFKGEHEDFSTEKSSEVEEQKDALDILEPKAEVRNWTIGKGDYERTYTQKPFSFIGRMEWFALVGEVLDRAMSGPNALTLSTLMETPGQRGQALSVNDFRDADTFVQGIGKLLVYAPDFLSKSYCIWLSVPKFERELAMELMALPEEEGGLTDDQGFEIIEVFIDQNSEALNRFFREKLPELQKRVRARFQSGESQQSRP